ncbi:MAG: hypothetical protein U0R24_09650 [Solirubrobacterales bacterium]
MRRRALAAALALPVALVTSLAVASNAAAYEPCPGDPVQPWMGASEGTAIAIPSLNQPSGIASYTGTIFRPADALAYPGKRPLVVLQHGLGGSQCGLHWAARMLAGHGYTSMVWTSPAEATTQGSFINAMDAMRSALAFARSPANPYADATDTSRITLAGHSLGSITSSLLQGLGEPGVTAVIALDTLRRYTTGDPGGAQDECVKAPAGEVNPAVPALSFAMDLPCEDNPTYTPDDLKLAGFSLWRSAGVPAMQLVLRGFDHADFSRGGTEAQHQLLAHYWLLWNRLWLDGDTSARAQLLAREVDGTPASELLSEHFRSAAYLPPDADTTDLAAYMADVKAPNTRFKGKKPKRHYPRGKKPKFRFEANEPATFECRLDDRPWRRNCVSPRRVKVSRTGRHTFRIRATDGSGNREEKPLKRRFWIDR